MPINTKRKLTEYRFFNLNNRVDAIFFGLILKNDYMEIHVLKSDSYSRHHICIVYIFSYIFLS